jgi:hypothetical protein
MEYLTVDNILPELKPLLDRLGYWLVDQKKVFINKNLALAHLTKTKSNDIKYCIYPDQFEHARWNQEPTTDLLKLYRLRAEQLRDNYDHLVLTYSGGSDSTNILHSFIENKIYPDEVISFVCKGKDFTDTNTNFNTEIAYNQSAIKQYVLSKNIKYSTIDISEHYNKIFSDDEWCFTMANNKAYINARVRGTSIDRFRSLVDKGKKCAVVYGLEKPAISIDENNNFFSYFLDIPLQQYTHSEMYDPAYNGLNMERFYVTGDMPELTIKQSYIVARYYKEKFSERSKKMLELGFNFDFKNYKENCMQLLYGHCFDQSTCFTIGKSTYITGLRDDWLVSLPDHDERKQDVIRGWKKLTETIDNKFFNNNQWYFDTTGCISQKYLLKI